LLSAFVDEQAAVSEEVIRQSIDELQWVPFNERTHARQMDFEDDTGSHETQERPKLMLTLNGSILDEFPMSKRIMTIGRKSDNDIQLDSGIVSRHHAQVKMVGRHCQLLDLNSRNGTCVNGKPVQKVDLSDGDEIAIGDHKLTYVEAKQADPHSAVEEKTGEQPKLDLTDTINVP
jgi:pSer/pThr/pTyr-binding forkhead associated (FHA) protein